MANRHTVEFICISHNGDGRLGHNGENKREGRGGGALAEDLEIG